MRYSCLHGWSFISSWWIFLFRTLTLERPPPPIGTQPPVESSRIITWARTRTTELPLKWIKWKENRMKSYNLMVYGNCELYSKINDLSFLLEISSFIHFNYKLCICVWNAKMTYHLIMMDWIAVRLILMIFPRYYF